MDLIHYVRFNTAFNVFPCHELFIQYIVLFIALFQYSGTGCSRKIVFFQTSLHLLFLKYCIFSNFTATHLLHLGEQVMLGGDLSLQSPLLAEDILNEQL